MDIASYVLGMKKGTEQGGGTVVIEGDAYTFTDDGEGNIIVEEVVDNG